MNAKPTNTDEYLASVPEDARAALEELRRTIRALAPNAIESFSYGMPAFKHQGRVLVYFVAWKGHCALYGLDVSGHHEALDAYDTSRGTIRFSPGEPLPVALVRTLLSARIAAIDAAAATAHKGKKSW